MIANLKPYPEYKDSGLPWLGQVPGHWEVKRPKQIGELLKGIGGTKEDSRSAGVPCVRYGELYTTHHYFIRRPKAFVEPARASAYTPIRYGDVLFAGSGEKLDEIGKSAVNLIYGEAVCGGDTLVLRPRINVYAPFLGYSFDCRPSALQKASMGRGTTVKHIYPDELKRLQISLPPPAEQAAIVRFLDHVNNKIERAIRAKQKMVKLVNEQKQAIIHRAVTRGLDPSVKLKDSGIPWLGEIPEHWEVRRAKYIFREVDERSKEGKETHLAMSQRLGLVPSNQVESAMRSESYSGAKLCQIGDLVLNRLKAHLGVFALAKQVGVISPDYTVFRKRSTISMEYYESLLRSSACRRELRIRAKGLVEGFWRLYTDDFYDIQLPVPPFNEQRKIMLAMSVQTLGLNANITRLEREIELLREYRTRLTSDVVTGKLDVRAAAADLPEQAEPLPADDAPPDEAEDGETMENEE